MRMESLPLTAGTENGRRWSYLLVIPQRENLKRGRDQFLFNFLLTQVHPSSNFSKRCGHFSWCQWQHERTPSHDCEANGLLYFGYSGGWWLLQHHCCECGCCVFSWRFGFTWSLGTSQVALLLLLDIWQQGAKEWGLGWSQIGPWNCGQWRCWERPEGTEHMSSPNPAHSLLMWKSGPNLISWGARISETWGMGSLFLKI